MQCHRSVILEVYRRTCLDVRMWELPLVHLSHTTCFDFYFNLKKLTTVNPHSVSHGVLGSNPGEDRL